MGRMRGVVERPAGLRYLPEVMTRQREQSLLTAVAGYEFQEVVLHGQPAKRTVRHFGVGYEYDSARVVPGDPLPPELLDLRTACAALVGLDPDRLAEALVTRYPPGATIGWHRDAPVFGSTVVGVSLRSPCTIRFQRRVSGERRVFELALQPRSGYVLAGPARATWQHSIPPVPELRYSITFRTLRQIPSVTNRVRTPGQ
jgi:DNA oxidative demethylase